MVMTLERRRRLQFAIGLALLAALVVECVTFFIPRDRRGLDQRLLQGDPKPLWEDLASDLPDDLRGRLEEAGGLDSAPRLARARARRTEPPEPQPFQLIAPQGNLREPPGRLTWLADAVPADVITFKLDEGPVRALDLKLARREGEGWTCELSADVTSNIAVGVLHYVTVGIVKVGEGGTIGEVPPARVEGSFRVLPAGTLEAIEADKLAAASAADGEPLLSAYLGSLIEEDAGLLVAARETLTMLVKEQPRFGPFRDALAAVEIELGIPPSGAR